MAKPPRLWKYGVPRVVGEQRTQRTRKLSTRVFFLVDAGDMASNTGEVLWMPPTWKQMLHGLPWRSPKGAEPDAVKAASPVLNGGDEETYPQATRLVPTQLQRRLKPGVMFP